MVVLVQCSAGGRPMAKAMEIWLGKGRVMDRCSVEPCSVNNGSHSFEQTFIKCLNHPVRRTKFLKFQVFCNVRHRMA